jgi:hypothetical protein
MEGGNTYGNVQGYYSKPRLSALMAAEIDQKVDTMTKQMKLSKDEISFIQARVGAIDVGLKARFQQVYEAWKKDWQHPMILISSNPVDRTYSPHYLELIGMNRDVLPLLMERLFNNTEDFFALQAVDRLLPAPLVVSLELGDEAVLSGEQGRALETVHRWVSFEA